MKYKVLLEQIAEEDLLGIVAYIRNTLYEPETAMRLYNNLKDAISSLDEVPMRYPVLREEPYGSLGVRFFPVDNYLIFYLVRKESREVHILRVVSGRRDWKSLL